MPLSARDAIKASFLHLLEERPLREITVKDIVQECGVNRNSFYYHFKDIPQLTEEIITDYAEGLIAAQAPAFSPADCMEAMARFAQEHRQIMLHINQSAHRDLFEQCLMEVCRNVVERFAAAAIGSLPINQEDREVLVRFYQCECFGQVVEWLNSGMRYDIARQARRLCTLGRGMTEMLIRRAMEEQKSAKRTIG